MGAKPEVTRRTAEDANVLLQRAERLRKRAFRARIGSNERATCLGQASELRAYATQLLIDKPMQAEIGEGLPPGRGWRAVAVRIHEIVRRRERERSKR